MSDYHQMLKLCHDLGLRVYLQQHYLCFIALPICPPFAPEQLQYLPNVYSNVLYTILGDFVELRNFQGKCYMPLIIVFRAI